jgi:hypothetical protein
LSDSTPKFHSKERLSYCRHGTSGLVTTIQGNAALQSTQGSILFAGPLSVGGSFTAIEQNHLTLARNSQLVGATTVNLVGPDTDTDTPSPGVNPTLQSQTPAPAPVQRWAAKAVRLSCLASLGSARTMQMQMQMQMQMRLRR